MISPKTAGAGAVAIGGSAATGVAIHQLTSETKIEINQTIKTKLEEAKFSINENDEGCQGALRKEQYSEENYKEAVKKCAISKDFSSRAKELKLEVLSVEEQTNTEWQTKWNDATRKAEIKAVTSVNPASGSDGWENVKNEVTKYCQDNNKKINEDFTNTEWHKFLKACTKKSGKPTEKIEETDKDFWTNKETFRAKITKAKFTLPDADKEGCTPLLNKAFEEENTPYKDAVIKCSDTTTFTLKVTNLQLTKLPTENDDNGWSDHWNTAKTKIQGLDIKELLSEKDKEWTAAKSAVQSWCKSKEGTAITNQTTNQDWKNYLTICVKDGTTGSPTPTVAEALKHNFWTHSTTPTN